MSFEYKENRPDPSQPIFSPEYRDFLASEFNISRGNDDEHFETLEWVARNNLEIEDSIRERPDIRVEREHWGEIAELCQSLSNRILATENDDILDVASAIGWARQMKLWLEYCRNNPVDHEFVDASGRYEPSTEEEWAAYDEIERECAHEGTELVRKIKSLPDRLQRILEDLPEPKRGPKPDLLALRWLSFLRQFWIERFDRPFTRDVTSDGEPISEAARFVVLASNPIGISKAKALRQMKEEIKMYRRGDGD